MLQAWWLDNVNFAKPDAWLLAWKNNDLNAIWKILSVWCNHLTDKLWYTDLNYSAGLNTWDLVGLEATARARPAPEEQRTQLCLAHRRGPTSMCQFEFIIDWVDQWECRRVAFGLLCVHRHSSSVGSAKWWGSQWHRCRSCWCGLRTLPRVFKVCVHDACTCLGILRSPCLLLRKQEHLLFVF